MDDYEREAFEQYVKANETTEKLHREQKEIIRKYLETEVLPDLRQGRIQEAIKNIEHLVNVMNAMKAREIAAQGKAAVGAPFG